MKLVFLLKSGIRGYRNFLFDFLNKQTEIDDLLVIHSGIIYDQKEGNYKDKQAKFIGSSKFGFHLGIWKQLRDADIIVSSYNLRIITCWLPCFFWPSKMIFWGKGLGNYNNRFVLKLREITANRSKQLLVYNQFKKQEMVDKLSINPNKVIAYQNTIKINHPKNYTNEPKKYFLYFGRLQKRKGLVELIEAYKNYLSCIGTPKYNLRIVGNGDIKKKLLDLTKEYALEKYIHFFPGVYNERDIANHFRNARLYVSPFNVGLSVIHSFSYGVPVLTCTKPQVGPEYYYLDDSNSIRVDDVSAFSDVFRLLETKRYIDGNKVFQFYKNNLHYSIMERNFLQTILKVKQ